VPIATVNDTQLYYEIHGEGEPAVCMGGWGTYCHKDGRSLARGLTDKYQVLVFDYRGVAQSKDDLNIPASMKLYADDLIALLDQLGWKKVHLIGLVGMGCGVAQEVVLSRPDLVRSMVNMGCWSSVDDYLRDQLELFRTVHREVGFYAFQQFVCVYSFLPEFYNQNKHRLLGPDGEWGELRDNYVTHERLVDACLAHNTADRLKDITVPTLVIHAAKDMVTSPRTTLPIERGIPDAEGVMMKDTAHVVAGKDQKIEFCNILFSFLDKH
jgi:3-oxoadipate enol-lactonase